MDKSPVVEAAGNGRVAEPPLAAALDYDLSGMSSGGMSLGGMSSDGVDISSGVQKRDSQNRTGVLNSNRFAPARKSGLGRQNLGKRDSSGAMHESSGEEGRIIGVSLSDRPMDD
jgi:hypothetical protein